MAKPKRKLTAVEKAAKALRRVQFTTIFINGRQRRVPRATKIEGLDADEFIARNADLVWLHQEQRWDQIPQSVPHHIGLADADELPS